MIAKRYEILRLKSNSTLIKNKAFRKKYWGELEFGDSQM